METWARVPNLCNLHSKDAPRWRTVGQFCLWEALQRERVPGSTLPAGNCFRDSCLLKKRICRKTQYLSTGHGRASQRETAAKQDSTLEPSQRAHEHHASGVEGKWRHRYLADEQLQTKEQIKTKQNCHLHVDLFFQLGLPQWERMRLVSETGSTRVGVPKGPYLLREGEGDGRTVCVWRGDWEGSEM